MPTYELGWCENVTIITMTRLNIRLPDILFNELDGAAFNQACEFWSSFAWKDKTNKYNLIILSQWYLFHKCRQLLKYSFAFASHIRWCWLWCMHWNFTKIPTQSQNRRGSIQIFGSACRFYDSIGTLAVDSNTWVKTFDQGALQRKRYANWWWGLVAFIIFHNFGPIK